MRLLKFWKQGCVPVLILLNENDEFVDRVNGYDSLGIEQLTSKM